jgi:hypothetical protein
MTWKELISPATLWRKLMPRETPWEKLILRAAPLLLFILVISYFAGDGLSAIPSGLVAWGTILLAYATFSLIQQSKQQETRRIEAEQAEAKNNNNLRILDEVIQWATDVASCRVERETKSIIELKYSFDSQAIRGTYILKIVTPFNQDLFGPVKILYDRITKQVEALQQYNDAPDESAERETKLVAVQENNREITESFNNVVDKATKIKLSLLSL